MTVGGSDHSAMHAGWAVSAYFSYMKGVNNALALKHVPQVSYRICWQRLQLAVSVHHDARMACTYLQL